MTITLERPYAATDKGRRRKNEDFIHPLSELESSGERLFMVCDGVGGSKKGEIASSLACESFQTYFHTFFEGGDPTREFINKAVRYTESRFDEYVKSHPEAYGMATTLTFLYIGTSGITMAHIGDSRIYQLRKGNIIHKTEDHSLVNSWVKLGVISEEEAFVHPQRNVITKAIMGSHFSVEADVKLQTDIRPGDVFLMCTDGVCECFPDEKLEKLFADQSNMEIIKDTIVEHCSNEANDNFSFYILPIQHTQKKINTKQFLLSFFYSFA